MSERRFSEKLSFINTLSILANVGEAVQRKAFIYQHTFNTCKCRRGGSAKSFHLSTHFQYLQMSERRFSEKLAFINTLSILANVGEAVQRKACIYQHTFNTCKCRRGGSAKSLHL